MRLTVPRDLLWAAALCGGAVVLLAAGAAFPDPLGVGTAEDDPPVAAADLAGEYRADPAAATGRYGRRLVRVRVRVDRVLEDGPGVERGHRFRVDQDPAGDDPGATARLPWGDRGQVRAGEVVVVWAQPRGYADGRLDLGGVARD